MEEAMRAIATEASSTDFDFGRRLQEIRLERGLSSSDLARLSGLTRSFLSRVENGQASPSLASMQKIAIALGMTLGALVTTRQDHSPVVRRDQRPRLRYPGLKTEDELLSPTQSGSLEVLVCTIDPGGTSGDEAYSHRGDEECVVVMTGALRIWVDAVEYTLEEGDAITFACQLPHRWENAHSGQTKCFWVITPPGF